MASGLTEIKISVVDEYRLKVRALRDKLQVISDKPPKPATGGTTQ